MINIVKNKHEIFVKRVANVNPNIEIIGEFEKNCVKVLCRCVIHDVTWKAFPQSLLRGQGCKQCGIEKRVKKQRYTKEQFASIIKEKVPNVDIVGDYLGRDVKILVRCKKDGYEWLANPRNLQNGEGCPLCSNNVVVVGINDVATTHPQIIKYFKDQIEANRYTYGSGHKTTFICPICHHEKVDYIRNVSRNGFMCNYCDGSISFPNKLLKGLMLQLPVDTVEYEYSPDWAGRYRYDAYFEYNKTSYVIEMDGGFHYRTGIGGYYSEKELEATQKRDKDKDNLAKANKVNVIRIDCNRNDAGYIIKQIKHSILSEIFDLSLIDWNKCIYYDNDKLKEICDYYNSHQGIFASQIAEELKYSKQIVSKYLLMGNKKGLCEYDPLYGKKYNNAVSIRATRVLDGTVRMFASYTDCLKEMPKVTGKPMNMYMLKKKIDLKQAYYGYVFETIKKGGIT